jgi:RNA polymerase sigma-70 factor (ECF subfamily)
MSTGTTLAQAAGNTGDGAGIQRLDLATVPLVALRLASVDVERSKGGGVSNDATPDEILMDAYQAGNEAAFSELYDRYSGSVYGFLVRRLGDRALADDLYQETFLRLHRAKATYDSRRPFRAWLFGIVHNLLTDTFRARARVPELAPTGDVAERQGDGPSPERLTAVRQEAHSLRKALEALSPDEATALILARLEGFSYDEIADVLGRSAAATKQLAYRALKRVRAEMTVAGHEEAS